YKIYRIKSLYGNKMYLVLTGVDLEEETAKKMKEMGILQIKDAKGKADWLIKNINSDFVKQYREILKEDIYRVAQHIDNQTQVQSNTSGTMLATRLNCLRIKITTQNQALKNCIKTRLKCLFRFLELTENKSYDYRNIDIRPQLNLPSNDVETAQIISQLNGKLSIQTGLERLSFITNGKAEFEKMLAEQKQINDNDMSSVSDLGDTNE
ncbi:MAG: phage portal protein, partial [Clostridium butyricum]